MASHRTQYPPILTPDLLAEILDLKSGRAAREFVRKHGIPHIEIGRRIWVRLETLDKWLAERETGRPEQGPGLADANQRIQDECRPRESLGQTADRTRAAG